MPHWHEHNPWKDEIVYVPIEELAECVAGGTVRDIDGQVKPYTTALVLEWWLERGPRLDPYILPCASGLHCVGVRYGAEGPEYLSPHGDPEKVAALLAKYSVKR